MNRILTLDRLRGNLRLRWPELVAISLSASVFAIANLFYELSLDEARVRQFALSLTLRELFLTHILYGGTQGLWHFLYRTLIDARIGSAGMYWICGATLIGLPHLRIFNFLFPRYIEPILPYIRSPLLQWSIVPHGYMLASKEPGFNPLFARKSRVGFAKPFGSCRSLRINLRRGVPFLANGMGLFVVCNELTGTLVKKRVPTLFCEFHHTYPRHLLSTVGCRATEIS
jgi:hypothetical protein